MHKLNAEEKSRDPVSALKKTSLFLLHQKNNAKMVPFSGYEMPLQYADMGIMKEHLHTRKHAGLFDVSHMGQAYLVSHDDPAKHLEKLCPSDLTQLEPGQMRYTVLLNEHGGIIDDLMVTRIDDKKLFLVVNAARKDVDFKYIIQNAGSMARLDECYHHGLLALQGPKAEKILNKIIPGVSEMTFMTLKSFKWNGTNLMISRSGYTGEDGFEISIEGQHAIPFANELLKDKNVALIGLGARDSLRLEAGLCLYGHDLNEDTTPVEANLKWVISKNRRHEKGFSGAETILSQITEGTEKVRVGIKPDGKAPLREGALLFNANDEEIGYVTSGCFAPSLKSPIAMGYINSEYIDTKKIIKAKQRDKFFPCKIAKLPFIKPNYKR